MYVDDLAVNSVLDLHKELGWVDSARHLEEDDDDEDENDENDDIRSLPSSSSSSSSFLPEIAPRHFNTVFVDAKHVIKSAPGSLLDGEIFFYRNAPERMRSVLPTVFEIVEDDEGGGGGGMVRRGE